MADINDLIEEKLKSFPPDVALLAIEALKLSEAGLPELSISEALVNVARRIIREKEDKS